MQLNDPPTICVVPERLRPPFRPIDIEAAWREWSFNCGPASLCAILSKTPDQLRDHMEAVGFMEKGYTNPTMMEAALRRLGITPRKLERETDWRPWCDNGLIRIQWGGPWMEPTVPIKARYRHTHWVASRIVNGFVWIFDINAVVHGYGWIRGGAWASCLVPFIVKHCVPRGDGSWQATHKWEIPETERGSNQ